MTNDKNETRPVLIDDDKMAENASDPGCTVSGVYRHLKQLRVPRSNRRVQLLIAAIGFWSPLPVLRERVRVRVISTIRRLITLGITLTPALSRNTGRGGTTKNRYTRVRRPILLVLALLASICMPALAENAYAGSATGLADGSFIAGADLSGVQYFQDRGRHYLDGGHGEDPLLILKRHGINFIRLRLFTSSAEQANRDPYDSGNNMDYTLPLARRVVKAGFPWMLDFHYSDLWADPGHQRKPVAWEGLNLDQLQKRMYEYNRDCISTFRDAGVMPRYVQVGNEITSGMVWPDAKTDSPAHWANLGRLMNAAIHGIRDAAGSQMPKIVVHIDRGANWGLVQWYFDHLREQHVDFDIMALSYYPDKNSRFEEIQASLNKAAERYGHPIILAETAFPFSSQSRDGQKLEPIDGIARSEAGQVKYIDSLCKIVKATKNGKGLGIFWWGTEYQPLPHVNLGGYENCSMFDHDGNALPVMDAFGRFGSLHWLTK
jgi:arabinogalactan endo-1,4-beta-galactosidase